MNLAKKYNTLFKSRLLHYAAWSPVTDRYAVGDFGAFKNGVFQRLGNIEEFGVDPEPRTGDSSVKFDFTSSGAVIVRTSAGARVEIFPQQSVEAKLQINFSGEDGFYIRTSKLSVAEMQSVDRVAQQLKGKQDPNGRRWQLRWRIVRKVYTAVEPTILASAEKNAEFTLSGSADALKALELGNGSANITVSSTRQDALQIAGGTGPIALDLFSVRLLGGAGLERLVDQTQEGSTNDLVEADLDEKWPDDPAE